MICVDELMPVIKVTGKWKWPESCHLFSDDDNFEELHKFAELIGLKKEWFQRHLDLPHYDLNKSKRNLAIKKGAKSITVKEMGNFLVERKKAANRQINGVKTYGF